ncbi:MAG TPA: glycosyltransferase family 87 protein [Patescibacteria group bacterium]|nr:glycosyltransferase family 87 protein [Patescibacteria group bacterium]
MTATPARRRNDAILWTIAAVAFWATTAWLGVLMFNSVPRSAAFDLDLLVDAGRSIGAGQTPYDPVVLRGVVPDAVDLFYSYPPIVGQVLVPISGLPLGLIAIGWAVAAIALLAVAVVRIGALVTPAVPARTVTAATIAVAAMTFPLLIAVLFGNLDAFFPALYGFVLIGALSRVRPDGVIGGVAIAIGALTKVYPAGFGLWFLVRAVRPGGGRDRQRLLVPVATAAVTAAGLVAASVALFGLGPWQDFAKVASIAAQAGLVDGRNAGPAAQVALWLGAENGLARLLHLPVVGLAVFAIAAAAWFRDDPLESLAIAATATLYLLPISWIHYPAALLPFVAAAVLRAHANDRRAIRLVWRLAALALFAGAVSIAWRPSLWLAVAFALLAVHASVSPSTRRQPVGTDGEGSALALPEARS